MKARETRGFTLIEVLVVVTIFGILSGMVIAQVLRARRATNEASAIGSLRAINTAQEPPLWVRAATS
jgi:type IV pilus assembly protein PilA